MSSGCCCRYSNTGKDVSKASWNAVLSGDEDIFDSGRMIMSNKQLATFMRGVLGMASDGKKPKT
jgi:hypothetical protein